ncbi:MAG: hypothetical protein ACRDZY_11725 [Acidimicrobiales bacterium]
MADPGAFVGLGTLCVIAGGLVAAANGLAPSAHGSWAAAYLVLVAGVAQVALGAGQRFLGAQSLAPWASVGGELGSWNLGNAAVITGTLLGLQTLTYAGSGLLVVALGLFALTTRHSRPPRPWFLAAYRAVVAALAISVPVGVVLAGAH